ncbi:MAG: DUF349 domain-containing protein [Pseudomonadales bacterium]|nr:DUF349 domain-containing protein [Pseudomonadales bacterium]
MIISRFLKPKWQHSNPATRKQSILKLDSKQKDYTDILALLALDPNTDVAQLAISYIHQLPLLNELLNKETSETRQQQALVTRIIDIVCDKGGKAPSEAEKLTFIAHCQRQDLLVCLSNQASDQTIQRAALEKVLSEEDLVEIACQSNSPAIRLAAVEKVHSHENLLKLNKQIRGRDKTVYRLVKDRLAIENEKQAKQKEAIQLRENLLSSIEALAQKTHSPQYPQKFALLQKQWSELDEQYRPSDMEKRFQQAGILCQTLVDEKKATEQQQKKSLAAAQELSNTCEALERSINDLSQNLQAEQLDIPAANAVIKTQQIRWEAASETSKPPSDLLKRYSALTYRLEDAIQAYQRYQTHEEKLKKLLSEEKKSTRFNEIKTLLNVISWPPSLDQPAQLKLAQEMLGVEKSVLKESKTEGQKKLKSIQLKLQELEAAIESGALKAANRLHKEVHQAEKDGVLNKNTQQRFALLGGQLKNLNGWQGFSSAHKKEELCEKMEALVSSSSELDDKASQIKLLQEQWKQSGASSDQALWVRFKSASDIAYEPCKAYFAQLADVRKKNLQERKGICEQLNDFIQNNDWVNANWQAAQEINRTARQQWKQFSPVDRTKGNAVQKQFNELLDKLSQLIQAEQTINIEKKESLIAEAKELMALNDEKEAIEKAKQLQTTWKTIGITPRKKDEILWKKFRQHCDALFERREHSQRQAHEDRNQQVTQARQLCEQLENASQASPEKLLEAPDLATQINKHIKALTDLPKDQGDILRKRYQKAAKTFALQLEKAKTLQQQLQLKNVKTLAEWLNTLASRLEETSIEQLEQEWLPLTSDIPTQWLSSFSERFQSAINKGSNTHQTDPKKIPGNLSLLSIRMEILAGLESPEEAKTDRMAYQVSRLSEKMKSVKKSVPSPDESAKDKIEKAVSIELEWLNLLSEAQEKPNDFKTLESRFELARSELWSQYSQGVSLNTPLQQDV